MALLVSACGGPSTSSDQQKAPADKQVFNWPLVGIADLGTFDPALVTTQPSLQAINMVFTGLVGLDDDLKVQPQMAQSWQRSTDGTHWTFTLKQGLKFSDGSPITSHDVAYSIDRALSPALASPASPGYLSLIQDSDKRLAGKIPTLINDSLITPNDTTISITTSKPASYFLAALTYPTSFVVEKKLIDKYGDKKFTDHLAEGGGAGPFKVQEYTHGQQIVFVPNPNYYGGKPQLQKVVFPFIKDPETAYKNYQTGKVDLVSVPVAHLDEARKLDKEYHKVPVLAIGYYGMNFLAKPFDNIHIRQAFALALNKDAIVKGVYKDVQTATNHIVPQGMPGYNEQLKGPDDTTSTQGNPALAKKLFQQGLKESGYTSVSQVPPIKFSYQSGNADLDYEITTAIQQWNSILGVNVKGSATDLETLSIQLTQTVGSGNLQLFYALWGADYPDPQDYLTLQFSKGVPNNAVNYGQNTSADSSAQVKVQEALAKADVTTDQTARFQAYADAEQQLVKDVAWLPVYQFARSRVLKPYVIGRTFNAQDLVSAEDWAKVYISVH